MDPDRQSPHRSPTSLYRRVFLPFSLTLVLTMIAAWWAAAALLTETLEASLMDRLTHATEVLASGSFPFTADLLESTSALANADFALLHEDGSLGPSTLDPDQQAAFAAHVGSAGLAAARSRVEGYALTIVPLTSARSQHYRAVLGITSLDLVRTAARGTALRLGAITLAAVAVIAWLGHRLSEGIAAPVRGLVDLARRIAAGSRSEQATEVPVREIAELSDALNEMTAKLADYEADLVAANRLASLGEVTTKIAHEIRNPLTAIKLQLQLLAERVSDPEQSDVTRLLLTEIQRLELVVASTLAFGRGLSIHPRLRALDPIVEEVTGLLGPQLDHLHVRLEKRPGGPAACSLDADRFKQVLFNLLTNAAEALPDGGTVRITTAEEADAVRIDIEDSGPGLVTLPAADGSMQSSKPGGIGLGLVVSREIVERHGGSLGVDRSPGLGGARFTIRLPRPDLGVG